MNGFGYEAKCARYLRNVGFHNVEITRQSGDQGIDIIAKRHGIKYGIQCKYYSNAVGNHAVMEAYTGAKFYHCQRAMVMTNSSFTAAANKLAKQTGVILWPGCKARLGLMGQFIKPLRWLNCLLSLLLMVSVLYAAYQHIPSDSLQLTALGCMVFPALMLLHPHRTTVLLSGLCYAASAALLQYAPWNILTWLSTINISRLFLLPIAIACFCLVHWLSLIQCEKIPASVREKI